jgi:DNA-binding NtrC family response regulator
MGGNDDAPREDESTVTGLLRAEAGRRGRLRLLVVGDGFYATHPLPEVGSLVIGRSERADVCIDDPLISRRHAVLHIGPQLTIEDLGSINGLRVRDERVAERASIEIAPGDAIDLGSTTLIVQSGSAALRPRRLWTHGAFEARLEDECARAERSGAQFAVIRVRIEGTLSAPAAQEVLGFELRSVDVMATYGPDEYEVLLVDTPVERATESARRLLSHLAERGARSRVGLACYPRDGRSPEEMVAHACAAVRGTPSDAGGAAIVVADSAMQRLHKLVKRIAAGTISVVLLGETGVGKEVLAETIHRESPRRDKPFLRLNCAALSETLLESELFGHERGAFTGALALKPGLLETAQGGTVFLDEVGELPMSIQVKLLRVIEERQVYRVGSVKPRAIDVRFVSATNRDLEAEVALGSFRQDLFFRLDGISLVIPPLRERKDEIPGLSQAFIAQALSPAQRLRGACPPRIDAEAMALLTRYSWPGNIRELRNLIERAVLLSGGANISLEHLPVDKMGAELPARPAPRTTPLPPRPSSPPSAPPFGAGALLPGRLAPVRAVDAARGGPPPVAPSATYAEVWRRRGYDGAETIPAPPATQPQAVPDASEAVRDEAPPSVGRSRVGEAERQRILAALEKCAGNQTKAARVLGMSRRTLVTRLETYALPRPRKDAAAE